MVESKQFFLASYKIENRGEMTWYQSNRNAVNSTCVLVKFASILRDKWKLQEENL